MILFRNCDASPRPQLCYALSKSRVGGELATGEHIHFANDLAFVVCTLAHAVSAASSRATQRHTVSSRYARKKREAKHKRKHWQRKTMRLRSTHIPIRHTERSVRGVARNLATQSVACVWRGVCTLRVHLRDEDEGALRAARAWGQRRKGFIHGCLNVQSLKQVDNLLLGELFNL